MKMGTIENDLEWEKIANACQSISELPITISTNVRTIQDIEYYAKTLKNQNKIDLMIIDYIQLLRDKDSFQSREQEVADISRRLKLLTLDLNIPIIALCQLNRNANEREPSMADLRESGSLEQDKSSIILTNLENLRTNSKIKFFNIINRYATSDVLYKLGELLETPYNL